MNDPAANIKHKPLVIAADDDEATLLVIKTALEKNGYTIECATDGHQVLEICRRVAPDLILMDAVMPKMDGYSATEAVIEKYGRTIPILIITSLSSEEAVERAYAVGAADFIPKPIHWPVLLQRVKHILLTKNISSQLDEERRRAENEKEQYEARLRQSHKMEAIGRLAGGVAHDFNNILTAIVGYVDLANDLIEYHDHDAKIKKYFKEIARASDRAKGLIRQMLDYSRKGGRKYEVVAVKALVGEVVTLLKSILPSSIRVDFKTSSDPLYIVIDPVQLHQVIMNLCINARDAMGGKGEISIRIDHETGAMNVCSSCAKSFSGDYVRISVTDTGEGIGAETLNKIFDPFFTTKEIGQGVGMGLSVVHGIAHHYDGHILVSSAPSKGSRFELYFPIADSEDKSEQYLANR